MDNTTSMVVYATLDKLGPNGGGTFFCRDRLEVGLNLSEFYGALNAGVQGDVLGICVTKASWEDGDRTIDIYLMNENGYSYAFKVRALALEYEPVKLSRDVTHVQTQLSISCTHFKRILQDCEKQVCVLILCVLSSN